MALNPFFLQGSPNEQNLIQELIDEHLKMFGLDCYYIPRKMIVTDDVLGEVQSSKFNDAYILEAYLNNYEGYAKGSDIMTKFGINLQFERINQARSQRDKFSRALRENELNVHVLMSVLCNNSL